MVERTSSGTSKRLWWMATAVMVCLALFGISQLAGCGVSRSVPETTSETASQNRPLSGDDVVTLDLSDESLRSPTRVTRLSRCSISLQPDGAVACDVVGSAGETDRQYGGVRFYTGPVEELELDIALVHAEDIHNLQVDLVDATKRDRLDRWVLSKPHGGPMRFVFRPGGEIRPFAHTVFSSGTPDAVDLLIRLTPAGSGQPAAHAGVIVNRVRYRRPSAAP